MGPNSLIVVYVDPLARATDQREAVDARLGERSKEFTNQGTLPQTNVEAHMSHSLNSLKGGYIRDYIGDYYRGD